MLSQSTVAHAPIPLLQLFAALHRRAYHGSDVPAHFHGWPGDVAPRRNECARLAQQLRVQHVPIPSAPLDWWDILRTHAPAHGQRRGDSFNSLGDLGVARGNSPVGAL